MNNNEYSKYPLNADNIKELIIDKICRDSWDESFGTSIEVVKNTLLITHNKNTLKEVKQFLSKLEFEIEK
jgi:hypothetical protein